MLIVLPRTDASMLQVITIGRVAEALLQAVILAGWPKVVVFFFFFFLCPQVSYRGCHTHTRSHTLSPVLNTFTCQSASPFDSIAVFHQDHVHQQVGQVLQEEWPLLIIVPASFYVCISLNSKQGKCCRRSGHC